MFAYFIEDWVYDKKHRKQADRFDFGTTQHAITGKKFKLGRLSDIPAHIKESVQSGVTTFVAVGDDTTANKLLNHIIKLQKESPDVFKQKDPIFGYVPIQEKSIVAAGFGIQSVSDALEALRSAVAKSIDIGLLNDRHYFFSTAVFPKRSALTFVSYSVTSLHDDHVICVANSGAGFDVSHISDQKFRMDDGLLDAVIAHEPKKNTEGALVPSTSSKELHTIESVFPITKISVAHKDKTIKVFADTEKQLSTPITVSILPKALQVIMSTRVS